MSLFGLGVKPWTCLYGRRGDCSACAEPYCPFEPRVEASAQIECSERCGACAAAYGCGRLREHLASLRPDDYISFKDVCLSGERERWEFRRCLWCRAAKSCEILRVVRRP